MIAGRDNLFDELGRLRLLDGVASVWTDQKYTRTVAGMDSISRPPLTQPLPSVYTPISLSAQGDESPYSIGTAATTYGYEWTQQEGIKNYPYLVQAPVTAQAGFRACQAVNSSDPAAEEVCAGFDAGSEDLLAFGEGSPLIAANGKEIGVGDRLATTPNAHTAFERLSIVHDLVTADLSRPVPNNVDWSLDGNSDVVSEGFNGQLTFYQGSGTNPAYGSAFTEQSALDPGYDWWAHYARVLRVSNFNGDGGHGLLAVGFGPQSLLDYFPADQNGNVDDTNPQVVGGGFNQFDNIVAINDFTGDGKLSLLAEEPNGNLINYEHDANGWVNGNGATIGGGFQSLGELMAFQWTNNGRVGLLGVASNGDLRYYGVDAHGNWLNGNGQTIGSGFSYSNLHTVFSVGSFGGTDTGSVMTVDNAGLLKVYQANGTGGWLSGNGIQIGVGFQDMLAML